MRRRPHRVRTGVATLGAATLIAISGIAAGTASAAVKRQAIPGTHPGWATKANLRPDHTVPVPAGDITVNVYLNSQNPTGLEQFAATVSNPSSPQYAHYLNAAQAQNEFGPTRAEAHEVANEFTADGLVVTDQQLGFGGFVQVAGTEAQIESVFDVSFGAFTDPEGDIVRAPTQAATLPASIAGDVAAVAGLDSGNHFMTPDNSFGTARHRHQPPPVDPITGVGSNGPVPPNDSGPASALPPPPANFYVAPPDSLFYGQLTATNEPAVNGQFQPWEVNGYIPGQIRGAYGVTNSGATGRGATVAVVDAYASPTMRSDADQFARVTGDQPFSGNQYEQHLASNFDFINECGASGWYGEETLDVEAVHGMAPNANVRYYGAADCTDIGLLAPQAQIVNTDSAQIVTNSWGEPADDATLSTVYDQVFQAGATEGIGFFFSSGDSGYEDPAYEDPGSDQIQVDYPTSSPWVTSVGGTSLAVGRQNNYEFETPWGTVRTGLSADGLSWDPAPPADPMANYDGSGGGGVSTQYTQPAYQAGVVPNSLATDVPEGSTTTPMRVIPDISAYADPSTGTLVGQTVLLKDGVHFGFALSRIGGTSLASPTMAGIEADAQQAAGHALGFANPAIYQRAGTSAFHDVDQPATPQFEVRNDFTNPATATGPLVTTLRQLGINGAGASALTATPGFDDATGVGSPQNYISSFFGRR